jgi:hypothetical protein
MTALVDFVTPLEEAPVHLPELPDDGEAAHGYPPPVRPAGTAVVSYCGVRMIVRGESTDAPPPDTCQDCIAVWRRKRFNR